MPLIKIASPAEKAGVSPDPRAFAALQAAAIRGRELQLAEQQIENRRLQNKALGDAQTAIDQIGRAPDGSLLDDAGEGALEAAFAQIDATIAEIRAKGNLDESGLAGLAKMGELEKGELELQYRRANLRSWAEKLKATDPERYGAMQHFGVIDAINDPAPNPDLIQKAIIEANTVVLKQMVTAADAQARKARLEAKLQYWMTDETVLQQFPDSKGAPGQPMQMHPVRAAALEQIARDLAEHDTPQSYRYGPPRTGPQAAPAGGTADDVLASLQNSLKAPQEPAAGDDPNAAGAAQPSAGAAPDPNGPPPGTAPPAGGAPAPAPGPRTRTTDKGSKRTGRQFGPDPKGPGKSKPNWDNRQVERGAQELKEYADAIRRYTPEQLNHYARAFYKMHTGHDPDEVDPALIVQFMKEASQAAGL